MTGGALLAPAEVSAEVTAFLTQLAVALHKQRAYPVGHPMRLAARDIALAALDALLTKTPSLRIGVGRDQLIVDEALTDPGHFIVRDLAIRLHRRQLGAIVFRAGITAAEFGDLLDQLSIESPNRLEAPPPPPESSEHLEVSQIAFDALALRGDDSGMEVDRLWNELASAVGGSGGDVGTAGFSSRLLTSLGSPDARAAVTDTLIRLGRLTRDLEGEPREAAEARLRDLLVAVPDDALGRLLDVDLAAPDSSGRLLSTVDWLPAIALVEVVEAAARAQKQEISTVLLRLLKKLARQARGGGTGRPIADRDLRHVVTGLLDDWTLADPNSKQHAHILEVLSRNDFIGPGERANGEEAIRVVQMAIEVNTDGDHLTEAVEDAITRGEVEPLVELLSSAGPGVATLAAWKVMTTGIQLRRLLAGEGIAAPTVAEVLRHVDATGAGHLIDRLLTDTPESLRVLIIVRLADLGGAVTGIFQSRLAGAGSQERRQLLAVLASLPSLPDGLEVGQYLTSVDPLTRVEAYRLVIGRVDQRDQAIHAALADEDERVVMVAVEAGRAGLPRASLSRLMVLLGAPKRSVELRAEAAELLAQFDVPTTRQWLVANLIQRRSWFRRRRLAPKTPLVLAKLRVLASRWRGSPEVDRILLLAQKSGDAELAAAAGGATS